MRTRAIRRPEALASSAVEGVRAPGQGATPSLPGVLALLALASAWAAPAAAQTDFELVCPCTVETANLTSVGVSFGIKSLLEEGDTGPLTASLEGRRLGVEGNWQHLATVNLPAVAAESKVDPKRHTAAFQQRTAGTWELRLRLEGDGFRARDSIYWLSEPVDMTTGGGSFSSVHFDGTPTVSMSGGNATLDLPALRNADGGVEAAFRLVGIAEIELDESYAFNETPAQRTRELIDLHGADVVVMFRAWGAGSSVCGHGIAGEFVTVMAYPQAFGFATKLDQFSDPDVDREGAPCGVAVDEPDGADAVTSLNATRFQVANFEAAKPDSDEDGFVDPVDAFPSDASEQFDFDGVEDALDSDDDNDGDVNGDGHRDLMIGAPDMPFGTNPDSGGVILLSGAAMDSLDAADGSSDGAIMISQASQEGVWKLGGKDFNVGEIVSAAGDTDGTVDFITDDQVPARSWRIVFENGDSEFQNTASLADLNGDGKPELILPARIHENFDGEESGEDASYIFSLAELSTLDLQDGKGDGVIHLDLIERRWSE